MANDKDIPEVTPDTPKVTMATAPVPLTEVEQYQAQLAQLRAEHPPTVDIRIPVIKDNDRPLLVSVNGKTYSIQRGKTVTVPYEVANVVELSIAQDEKVIRMMADLVEEFVQKS